MGAGGWNQQCHQRLLALESRPSRGGRFRKAGGTTPHAERVPRQQCGQRHDPGLPLAALESGQSINGVEMVLAHGLRVTPA
jgi:hypothetical protein